MISEVLISGVQSVAPIQKLVECGRDPPESVPANKKYVRGLGGNHLSNTACLTQVFFKRGE